MENTTICLIDDHAIVRNGLKELLHKIGNYRVIHEFNDGQLFLSSLPLDPSPDIYILDYSMPHINGIEVLQAIKEDIDELKFLLLTQHFDERIINEAYYNGAKGFLHKNCTAADLKYAIDNIIKIGYNNITEILKRIRNYENFKGETTNIVLSPRESDFLRLVCDERELTYEQIADLMHLSVKSIEAYRAALFEKYDIKSKVGLVLFSFKHRLTEPFL